MSNKALRTKKAMNKSFFTGIFGVAFYGLFLVKVIHIEVLFSVFIVSTIAFYLMIYKFKSAYWHLVVEAIGGGAIIIPAIAISIELIARKGINIHDQYILLLMGFGTHFLSGLFHTLYVDIPAWKRSKGFNVNKKVNVVEGVFDISIPWYFSGAATEVERFKSYSFVGLGAAIGPILGLMLGANFVFFVIMIFVILSGIFFWHRMFLAMLLIRLSAKSGKPILLSVYR